jgi:hypothetical protein
VLVPWLASGGTLNEAVSQGVPFTVVTPLLMILISAPGVVFLREMAVWQSSSGGFTTPGSVSGRRR